MLRTKSTQKPKVALVLPKRIHASDDELAVLTRLIRVMRLRDSRGRYWLGPFIEWLLYLDATDPDLKYIQPGRALKALGGMEDLLLSDCKFIKMVRKECRGLAFVSAHPGDPESINDSGSIPIALPDDEEEQFYQLIRLWRREHPEPPKPRQIPTGKTQREMDPDSD